MRLKFTLIITVLITINSLNGQEDEVMDLKSIVSIGTFSPTIYSAPRWNVGYQKRITERYWLGLKLGYGDYNSTINYSKSGGQIKDNYQLYEIRPEIFYDLKPNSTLKHLVSFELFFINHTDQYSNGSYYNINQNIYYRYDLADYKRVKYGFNINNNFILYLGKNFALMQNFGIGFRHRNVTYTNTINEVEDPFFEEESIFGSGKKVRAKGVANGLNVNFDIRLIYVF